jgi:hypothetical protein
VTVPKELVCRLQEGFRSDEIEIGWAAQCLDRKMLVASGIFLAMFASAGYLLLHDEKNLVKIEDTIANRLGFLEELYC